MSGFSANWLALREPFDRRARNADVLEAVVAALKSQPSVRIADLACGTGSTLRALTSRLPAHQHWRLADNDLGLLARAAASPRAESVTVATVPLDLNRDLEAALDGPVDLVTTSALLDLVSQSWLERLVVEIAARAIPLYAALSYDGRIALTPADPLDEAVVAAVNAHQGTDKGFGPALGPQAAGYAIARFRALGYAVVHGASDWSFGPDDRAIQTETLNGWAAAARAMDALPSAEIEAWLARRSDAVAAGHSAIRVGHVDFFAMPTGTR